MKWVWGVWNDQPWPWGLIPVDLMTELIGNKY